MALSLWGLQSSYSFGVGKRSAKSNSWDTAVNIGITRLCKIKNAPYRVEFGLTRLGLIFLGFFGSRPWSSTNFRIRLGWVRIKNIGGFQLGLLKKKKVWFFSGWKSKKANPDRLTHQPNVTIKNKFCFIPMSENELFWKNLLVFLGFFGFFRVFFGL